MGRPQGWYLDPFGAHEARYFSDGSPTRLVRDGGAESYDEPPASAPAVGFEQLTEAPSPGPDSYAAVSARTLGRSAGAIMVITAVAAAVALAVVVISAISERPISGLRIAVVPAAAVLVVGQLWVIAVLYRRHPRLWLRLRPLGFGEATGLFFSPLPRRIVLGILAVFVLGLLSAATATLFLANGVPSTGTHACPYPAYYHGSKVCISKSAWWRALASEGGGATGASHVTVNSVPSAKQVCPYRLTEHGSMTCVSKAAYLRAVAAGELAGAGVMLGFFVAHFGVAWSEVLRSRQARLRAAAG